MHWMFLFFLRPSTPLDVAVTLWRALRIKLISGWRKKAGRRQTRWACALLSTQMSCACAAGAEGLEGTASFPQVSTGHGTPRSCLLRHICYGQQSEGSRATETGAAADVQPGGPINCVASARLVT